MSSSSDGKTRQRVVALVFSVLGIVIFTVPLFALNRNVAASLVPLAYLVPVIFAATRWGVWPSLVASIAAVAAADFFFLAPIYSFRIEDPQEAVDLLLFLIVSLVCAKLASRLRQETESLRRREEDLHALYDLSRRLAACFSIEQLIAAVESYLERAFGGAAAFLITTSRDHLEPVQSQLLPGSVQEAATEMSSRGSAHSRMVIDAPSQTSWLLRAICAGDPVFGVIAIKVDAASATSVAVRAQRLESMLAETAMTLHRLDIGNAMESGRLHLQEQMLRDAFHGTLSHELCSPLAAIQGSASVLESLPFVRDNEKVASLVEAISDESTHLNGYIRNLLNATHVTAGGLTPRIDWADPKDIVNGAIRNRARRLAAHRIEAAFSDDLPLLQVDSALIEEACGQILENAAKYSSSGSLIQVTAVHEQGHVMICMSDQGIGMTLEEQQYVGRRSFRGVRHQTAKPGSGLGLWVAVTFVRANGGTLSIQSLGAGGGTTVTIVFPVRTSVNSLVDCPVT